jgi:hypothetical protein
MSNRTHVDCMADRHANGKRLLLFPAILRGDADARRDEIGALVDVIGALLVEGEAGVAELTARR